MKSILNIVIILLLAGGLFAGDLFIDVQDTVAQATPGESVVFEGYVHNLSSGVMVVQMTRTVNNIPENWTTTLCFGANCYPPQVSAPDAVALNPGDSLFFDIVFNTDEIPSMGMAVLRFEDLVSGLKDSLTFTVSTQMQPAFSYHFADTAVTVIAGDAYTFETYIHNLTDSAMVFQVTRVQNDIPEEWATTMCLGVSCYPPGVSEVSSVIMPGDSVFFDIVVSTAQQPDSGHVLLQFADLLSGQTLYQNLMVVSEIPKPSIAVWVKDSVASGVAGQELVGDGMIYNISDTTQKVVIIRKENQLPEGWSSSLCFENCYAPEIDTIATDLNSGDSLEFSIHFFTTDQPGKGRATLLIFAEGSSDTLEQTFTAETQSTGLQNGPLLQPNSFLLLGNFPNPFNNATIIEFVVPANTKEVVLKVFSTSGAVVFSRRLQSLSAGRNHFRFSAPELASGLYFYQLTARNHLGRMEQQRGKMLLIK